MPSVERYDGPARAAIAPRAANIAWLAGWTVDSRAEKGCSPFKVGESPVSTDKVASRPAALRKLLSGGDRRSVAQSQRARKLVEAEPRRVADLAQLAEDEDWLVSMRAMDLLEKLAHDHPDWIEPHKRLFIGPLAESDQWELRLQVVRALPLLTWTASELRRVLSILRRDLEHPQKFVRAWALDGLATFALSDARLLPRVTQALDSFERSGSKALAARAKLIRKRLAGAAGRGR